MLVLPGWQVMRRDVEARVTTAKGKGSGGSELPSLPSVK